MQLGTRYNYKMPLNLDPRNAILVLELVPNLGVSGTFIHLTTSAEIGTQSTPGGSHETKFFPQKFSHTKVFRFI